MAGARTALFARNQPGGMFTIENQNFTTGSHFFVHSGTGTDGAGYGQNPDAPCATIDYAMGLCTASVGDIIHVMPGHAETVGSATGCVCDKIGVTVRGVTSNTGLMPKITVSTADTALISVTAAGVTLENLWVIANFLNIASLVSVAATDCTIRGCRFTETGGNLNALITILTAAAAASSRLVVEDCYFDMPDTDNTIGISIPGTPDGVIIRRNLMLGDWGTAAISSAGVATNLTVCDNYIYNVAALPAVLCAATATGMLFNNRAGTNGIVTTGYSADAMVKCENYHVDIAGGDVQGILDPVAT